MATLDYAFLAEYAHVEGGKLSALGASYTHAQVASINGLWMMSIAGRVRTTINEPPVELGFRIVAPDGVMEMRQNATVAVDQNARPYGEGKVGVLFATTLALPILATGLHEVFITLNGEEARRLAFDMSVVQ